MQQVSFYTTDDIIDSAEFKTTWPHRNRDEAIQSTSQIIKTALKGVETAKVGNRLMLTADQFHKVLAFIRKVPARRAAMIEAGAGFGVGFKGRIQKGSRRPQGSVTLGTPKVVEEVEPDENTAAFASIADNMLAVSGALQRIEGIINAMQRKVTDNAAAYDRMDKQVRELAGLMKLILDEMTKPTKGRAPDAPVPVNGKAPDDHPY